MSDRDYIVDIPGLGGDGGDESEDTGPAGRPYISVHFACCKTFARIYLNKERTAYVGWCPRCARKVIARIDPNGSTDRVFVAQ